MRLSSVRYSGLMSAVTTYEVCATEGAVRHSAIGLEETPSKSTPDVLDDVRTVQEGDGASAPAAASSSGVVELGSSASAEREGAAESVLPTLDEAIRAHIIRALGLSRGRIEGRGGAADLLGVNPHTLRGKMRRLKLDWSRYRVGNTVRT